MSYARNGKVSLYYEDRGPKDGPGLVMIEGYTAQLVGWPTDFVSLLNSRGIRTLLLDNRDVGLSDKVGTPEQTDRMYSIQDMADDVVAVADAAGLHSFSVIGESMGGMIAQQVLASHADRIASAIIMFTVPSYDVRWMAHPDSANSGSNEGLDAVKNRDEAIRLFVGRERACHEGSAYVFDEDAARELGGITYDRCYRPDGWRRQNAAIEGFAVDEGALAAVDVPTAVIHGRSDPFFSYRSGEHIADLLRESELHVYPGMAHELPRPLWEDFASIIARTVQRGEKR